MLYFNIKNLIKKIHQKLLAKTKQLGPSQPLILNFNINKEAGIFLLYQLVKYIPHISRIS